MKPYISYYDIQAGGGALEKYNNFGRVYVGSPYQRGSGIGSWLGGLFRTILPYFGGAARAVGKEALNAGLNIVGDVVTNKVPFKASLENRLSESGINLKRKAVEKLDSMMRGSGYKRKTKRRRMAHRLVGRGTVKKQTNKKKPRTTVKKSKKKNNVKRNVRDVYDIFG